MVKITKLISSNFHQIRELPIPYLYNDDDSILSAASTYQNIISWAISSLIAKLHMWRSHWKYTENILQIAIEAIQSAKIFNQTL